MNTIKNDSKIGYKAKQDNGNTYVKPEEHADLHMSSMTQLSTRIETSDDLDAHPATEKRTCFDIY